MSIWANSLSVLVITNECLSNCFIYDQECCYRHYGAENVDWQSLAFTLWPTELPLGFLLFWLDERETWSISARSAPEIVGVKSALCYAKQQTGVLPLAIRRAGNGEIEIANVFMAGSCPVSTWHRHRAVTRVTNKLVSRLVSAFAHVSFWRRETSGAIQ